MLSLISGFHFGMIKLQVKHVHNFSSIAKKKKREKSTLLITSRPFDNSRISAKREKEISFKKKKIKEKKKREKKAYDLNDSSLD